VAHAEGHEYEPGDCPGHSIAVESLEQTDATHLAGECRRCGKAGTVVLKPSVLEYATRWAADDPPRTVRRCVCGHRRVGFECLAAGCGCTQYRADERTAEGTEV
jgi:hypothetical protein